MCHLNYCTGLSDEECVNFVQPKNICYKKTRKKTTQKIETVKYKVLFDHIFSDRNYSKVYKFCRYTISHSFFKLYFAHVSDFDIPLTKLSKSEI